MYLSEYKRRQAAPGVKITERNFGRDRRYPIVNRFREIALRMNPEPDQSADMGGSSSIDGWPRCDDDSKDLRSD